MGGVIVAVGVAVLVAAAVAVGAGAFVENDILTAPPTVPVAGLGRKLYPPSVAVIL